MKIKSPLRLPLVALMLSCLAAFTHPTQAQPRYGPLSGSVDVPATLPSAQTISSTDQLDATDKSPTSFYADFFRISVAAAGQLEVTMDSGDNLDTYLKLFNASGEILAINDDDDTGVLGVGSRIVYSVTEPGIYYIIASTFQYRDTGAYTLNVVSSPTQANFLPPQPSMGNVSYLLEKNVAFSYQLAGGDGNAPSSSLSYSKTSGTLPAGMTVGPNGLLSGTPTANGTTTATIQVSNGSATASGTVRIEIINDLDAPRVTTPTSANIANTSATLGGNVTDIGSSAITERGVVVAPTSVDADPNIGDAGVTKIVEGATTTGVFTVNAAGLTPNTNYSFAAYATNAGGTNYTPVATFTTTISDPTGAAGLVVTTTQDVTAADGFISLREAIIRANGDGVASEITFSATVFGAPRQTIKLNGTELPALAGNNTLTITAPAAGVEISGEKKSRVFAVNSDADVTMTGLTIRDGDAGSNFGGGIYNVGKLLVEFCTLKDNSAGIGGALYSRTDLNGKTLTLRNCTLSGNTATGRGGGLRNIQGLSIIESCTIVGNEAPAEAGGGVASSGNGITRTEVRNSIIAGNTGSDVGFDNGTNSFQSNGYNLIGVGNATGAFNASGDVINNTAPGVAALDDDLGRVPTRALLAGSPAINAGDPAFDGSGKTDARGAGFARVRDGRLDIGAFEVQNDAPTDIALTPNSIAENAGADALVGTLSTLDSDAGDTTFTYAFASGTGDDDNAKFTITGDKLTANGSFDFETTSSYTVRVSSTDAGGLSFEKAFVISVTNVNEAPVATDQSVTAKTAVPLEITLSASDVDGDALTYSVVQPAHGTVTLDGNVATYTSSAGYVGPDSFGFTANDGQLDSDLATVSIAVEAIPTANDVSASGASGQQFALSLSGTDPAGGGLTFRITQEPTNGFADIRADGAGNSALFYRSNKGFAGTDIVRFVATDVLGRDSLPATATFTLSGNMPPTANDVRGSGASGQRIVLPLGGVDPVGGGLTFTITQAPRDGKASIRTDGKGHSSLFYTSNRGFDGLDLVRFVATDSTGAQSMGARATLVIQATALPSANNVSGSGASGQNIVVPLSGADPSGGGLSYAITGYPANGSASIRTDGRGNSALFYRSNAGFVGSDSVQFEATDNLKRRSTPATATLNVTAASRSTSGALQSAGSGGAS